MKRCASVALCFVWMISICLGHLAAQGRPFSSERMRSESSLSADSHGDFFPLEVGNEWVYSNGTQSFKVLVQRETEEVNHLRYFEILGYFPDDPSRIHKIRKGELGQILEFNPEGEDFLWYNLGKRLGSWRFQTGNNVSCITGSLVNPGATGETVEVPAGNFGRTIQFDFVPTCMDAGVTREYFAGGIGLVTRVVTTFGGPKIFKLVSASIGSEQFPVAPYGIEVSMDQPVYSNNLMPPVVNPWPTAKVTLIVRNETETPLEFTFPTAQRFDFLVRDESGNEVLRWSDGQAFTQEVGKEVLVKESRRYAAEIVLKTRRASALPPGLYTLTGFLAMQPQGSGAADMSATIRFEITNLH